jgi:hypothetical protein
MPAVGTNSAQRSPPSLQREQSYLLMLAGIDNRPCEFKGDVVTQSAVTEMMNQHPKIQTAAQWGRQSSKEFYHWGSLLNVTQHSTCSNI